MVNFVFLHCLLSDLLEMNTKRAPQDKLSCIVKCSKCIFRILFQIFSVVLISFTTARLTYQNYCTGRFKMAVKLQSCRG